MSEPEITEPINTEPENVSHMEEEVLEDDEVLPTETVQQLPPPEQVVHDMDCLHDPTEATGDPNLINSDTKVMTMAELINERYTMFNKALIELGALIDSFPNDKKVIRSIQAEYLKLYERFFDVIKYIYGLDIGDNTVKPGTSADRVIFKRQVLDPKRIIDSTGEKLLIYTDKDGKYRFVDETFANGEGPTLNDLAFWVANRDNFLDSDIAVQSSPVCITIFGKTVYIPTKGLRLSGTEKDQAQDRFWAIVTRMYKTLGALINAHRETKKANKAAAAAAKEKDLMINF